MSHEARYVFAQVRLERFGANGKRPLLLQEARDAREALEAAGGDVERCEEMAGLTFEELVPVLLMRARLRARNGTNGKHEGGAA